MRSAVAESRREVSTDDSIGCEDDNGNAQKRIFGVDTVLPEHVCQAESGCVMSCNLTTGATEV